MGKHCGPKFAEEAKGMESANTKMKHMLHAEVMPLMKAGGILASAGTLKDVSVYIFGQQPGDPKAPSNTVTYPKFTDPFGFGSWQDLRGTKDGAIASIRAGGNQVSLFHQSYA